MPLVEALNAQNDGNKAINATERESKLYVQLKDGRETIRVLKHQISDLTAERELLKQNFMKISSHLKKSLNNLNWYKTNKNKLSEIIKNLEENNMILKEKVDEYEGINMKLKDDNIRLNEELLITTKQKDEAFNILKSDFSDPNTNSSCNKNMLQKYTKHDLIDMVQDLQNDLSTEHNVVQYQLHTIENYTKEIQQLRIENAQMKDRFISDYYPQHTDTTLTWERVTESNSNHVVHKQTDHIQSDTRQRTRQQTPKYIQLSSNNMHQTEIQQPQLTYSHISSPKSVCNQSETSSKNSLFMSLLKAPPVRSHLAIQQTAKVSRNNVQISSETGAKHAVSTWNVEDVYQWAKKHQFIGIQSIANQLKQHEINGDKLQKLDEITLHIFGVPSKYISKTFKIIKSL